jgi:hypothetical protein
MKTRKLFLYIVFILISFSFINNSLYSQYRSKEQQQIENLKNEPLNFFAGISFTNMVPQKAYMDNLPKSGQGFSLYGGFSADPMPLALGLECDFLFNGSNSKYDTSSGFFQGLPFLRRDTISTQSMVIPINIFVRIQQNIMGYFMPYAEFVLGMNILTLSQNFNSGVIFPGDTLYPNKTSDSKSSVALAYGVGVGAMVKLVDFINLPSSHSSLDLDIRLRYMKGGEASYWKTESIYFDDTGRPVFNTKEYKSETDMVDFIVGLVYRF